MKTPWRDLIRQRAVMMFGKLRVWDTEHNNGVLIYVLLAEHAIEIVADRGLMRHVDAAQWQAMVARMASAFREKRYEDGLTQALEETSALLVAHFARTAIHDHLNDTPLLQCRKFLLLLLMRWILRKALFHKSCLVAASQVHRQRFIDCPLMTQQRPPCPAQPLCKSGHKKSP